MKTRRSFYICNFTKNKEIEAINQFFSFKKSSQYLSSLQTNLDKVIDKRLSRTFYDVFMVIIMFRNSKMGLLLSELGGYVCGFAHAPAGIFAVSKVVKTKALDQTFLRNAKKTLPSSV